MRASVIPEAGDVDVIEIQDVPEPTVETNDVLVDVKASAVNHTDVWIRRGFEGELPIITGIDVAGVVAETGAEVTDVEVGDRVVLYWNTTSCGNCEFCNGGETTMCHDYGGLGVLEDGGHAEYVSAEARHVTSIPDDLSMVEAAAVPSSFGTAWRAMVTRADVSPSDKVLVFGASGGVGHAVVQIASMAGATVYACTSSNEATDKLRELGADEIIDHTAVEIDDAVTELTAGRGVDIVFESIGGVLYEKGIKSLARGGQLVTIGATTGDAESGMLHHVFWKQLDVSGATGCTRSEFDKMLDAVFAGELRPVVDDVIELEDIPTAHERLENGDVFGRVVAEI